MRIFPLLSATWWDGLLGLRALSAGSEGVQWGLARPLPGWGWVLVVLGVLGFSWWAYHRMQGGRVLRGLLAGLRGLALLLVVLLLCGPELVLPGERVEQDVLVMLVDRSASMGVADMVVGGADGEATLGASGGGVVSREVALRGALENQWGAVLDGLPTDREVRWLGFGEGVFGLGGVLEEMKEEEEKSGGAGGFSVALGEADQWRTRLRTAVSGAVNRAAGRPVAGVVVISDGQSRESVSSALLAKLKQAAVRVYVVPMGAKEAGADWSVQRVDAPARAFARDAVPVSVVVDRRGGEAVGDESVTVRLVDTRGTEDDSDDGVLDEQVVSAGALSKPVRLEGVSEVQGDQAWVVEVVGETGEVGGGGDELNTANNRKAMTVAIVDRPIRVLYVEGVPRWEYRYLKNLLVREPSIDSSVLLLSADASFAQEGDTPITRLPADAQEFGRYDVVILGDVPGAYFSEEQVGLLRDLVSRRGVGLLWVGGPGYTPGSWAGTRLADLLPMTDPGGVSAWEGGAAGELAVRPTSLAEALSVLRLEDSSEQGGHDIKMEELPGLRWVQVLGPLKPVAEVLAVGEDAGQVESLPVVVRMRYGSGQTVYVATDETWRWRRGIGERYPERFWVQLVRMLGRGAVVVGDERARLTASTRTALEGETIVFDLTVEDAALLPTGTQEIALRVHDTTSSQGPTENATTGGAGGGVEVRLRLRTSESELPGGAPTYTGQWTADRAGTYQARPTLQALSSLEVSATVEVISADDELRRPEADHEKLIALAQATGGEVIPLTRLARLNDPGVVRSVARRVADDQTEPVGNSPLAFALLLGLLGVEWAVRRAIRLA